MKKMFVLLLMMFATNSFASGIASNAASAPCTNNTLETYSGNSNLSADWQPNTIQLRWYNEQEKLTVQQSAQSCTYDGTLSVPSTQPTRTGYTFAGWEVKHTVPAGYTELEYLESTGTQYIDTGLKANLNTKVEIVYKWPEYTSNELGYVFGCRENQDLNAFIVGTNDRVITQSSHLYAQFDSVHPNLGYGVVDLNKHTVSLSSNGFYFDSVLTRSYNNATNFTTPGNILIFASKTGGLVSKGKVDIYSFSMWDNNSLVQNLVPARRDSDNVLGMWDTVSKTFLTNSGTGTFVAGPVVQ